MHTISNEEFLELEGERKRMMEEQYRNRMRQVLPRRLIAAR
jgi:hypothetical protein